MNRSISPSESISFTKSYGKFGNEIFPLLKVQITLLSTGEKIDQVDIRYLKK